jgi:dTDP-4-amino-4,6-dideoxygalactose transaminase
MKIKFGDITINNTSKAHVLDCLIDNHVTMGGKTALLEKKWTELFGHTHTVAVNSGTSACIAMCLSLYEFGAKPGDEIIVPALSFIATANAVRAAGFTPRFVDIEKETLNINPELIEQVITNKTRAIMFVNLMGKPAKIPEITAIAGKYNLWMLGDCCESHGCMYDNKYMESHCDATAYSCYAAHILFSGELGFVCTNNERIATSVKSTRTHGRHPGSLYFDHVRYGLNLKPTDLHASIGLGNIDYFWDIFNKRYENVKYLSNGLTELRNDFWFSEEDPGYKNSPHAFSLTMKPGSKLNLVELQKTLDDAEIEWKRNFGAMPNHGAFSYLKHTPDEFPCATYVGNNGLHIGCHQYLEKEHLDYVIDILRKFAIK